MFPVQQLVLTSFEGTSPATQSCMLGKRKSVTWGTRPFPAETRPLSLFTGSQMAKVRCCCCYRTLKCCLTGGHQCEAPDETTRGSCCTSSNPCPAGGGDCDADSDCGPGLSISNASNNVSVSIYSQAESENCSQVLFVATIIVLDPSSFTTMTAVEIQYVTFQNLNFQWKYFAE